METKYIFIDIDGTLFSHTKGISYTNLKAIDTARKNGHKVFLCTGRVNSSIDDYLKFYPFDGYVLACGGHIIIDNKEIKNDIIDQDQVHQLIDLLHENDIGVVLEGTHLSYYDELAFEYFFRDRQHLRESLPPEVTRHLFREDIALDLEAYYRNPTHINKLSIGTKDPKGINRIKSILPKEYELIAYETSGEIIIKGEDKANGLKFVLDYFNTPIQDSYAFGDSMNDYSMIKEAGQGIVMSTGNKKVKAIADYITDNEHNEGIYNALKHFNLI